MTTTMNRVTVLDRAELTQQLTTVGREAGKAAQAPDKEKLITFRTMISDMNLPYMKTEKGHEANARIGRKLLSLLYALDEEISHL